MRFDSFTEAQRAGQRLMVGFEGKTFNNDLAYLIDTIMIGGVILFARNLETPEQIASLCRSIQRHARKVGQPPLFIAVDQEGGMVARLKPPFTVFAGNPHMQGVADAERFATVTAEEMSGVGLNMDLAPVLDVSPEGISSVMAKRVFGSRPEWVAHMGTLVIRSLQANGVMAVAKHFPGIGRTVLDSHVERPTLDSDPESLSNFDLVPFRSAIDVNVAGIMLSHILYPCLDNVWPASLSAAVAKDLLRRQLGYKGVVMTDDLDMGAIKKHHDIRTATRRILVAEIDLALICHRSEDIETAFETICKSERDDEQIRHSGDPALKRLLHLKEQYLGWPGDGSGID